MTPNEIWNEMQRTALCNRPGEAGVALLALRDLLVQFLEATDGPSMQAMSSNQLRFLNQLHVAVDL